MLNRSMTPTLLAAGLGLALSAATLTQSAWADVRAEYRDTATGDTIVIHFKDDNRIRLEATHDDGPGALLFLDDRVYAIQDGEYTDLTAMQGLMQGVMAAVREQAGFDPSKLDVRRTDRRETVLGYRGYVYELDYDGNVETAVLASHRDLAELERAFVVLSSRMAGFGGESDGALFVSLSDARFRERAPLRLEADGSTYELTALDRSRIDDAVFSLTGLTEASMMPEGVDLQSMEDAMRMLIDAMNSPEAQEALQGLFGGSR